MAILRDLENYPERDLVPEHTKRRPDEGTTLHPDVLAAYAYVESVLDASDLMVENHPAWFGWALREAFLAGASYAQAPNPSFQRTASGGR